MIVVCFNQTSIVSMITLLCIMSNLKQINSVNNSESRSGVVNNVV